MSTIPNMITGGCHCGSIRYEASTPPATGGVCHCRDCQRSTGSAFMVIANFNWAAFRFTKGKPKKYRSSPIMEKGFCSNCGSLLYDRYLVQRSKTSPDHIWVQVGTLDHPEAVPIEWHSGVESQLPWVHFDDGLPRNRCNEDPDMASAYAAAEAGKYPELVEIESSNDRFT